MQNVMPLSSTLLKREVNIIADCQWLAPFIYPSQYYHDIILPREIIDYACSAPIDVPGYDECIELDLLHRLEFSYPTYDHYRVIEEVMMMVEIISVQYYEWLESKRFPTNSLLQSFWIDGRDISGLLVVPRSR